MTQRRSKFDRVKGNLFTLAKAFQDNEAVLREAFTPVEDPKRQHDTGDEADQLVSDLYSLIEVVLGERGIELT